MIRRIYRIVQFFSNLSTEEKATICNRTLRRTCVKLSVSDNELYKIIEEEVDKLKNES